MTMIMLYFQFCHKPKHLREILRQPVKPKHSWALMSPVGIFYPETNNSRYIEKSNLPWVTERLLLSHHVPRHESHCQDFLKCACDAQRQGCLASCAVVWAFVDFRSSAMRSCQTCRCHLPHLQHIPRPTSFSSSVSSHSNPIGILPDTMVYQALDEEGAGQL